MQHQKTLRWNESKKKKKKKIKHLQKFLKKLANVWSDFKIYEFTNKLKV